MNSSLEVHQRHGHFVADTANASDICTAVYSTVKRLNETERWWQVAEVRGYNSVGTQMLRLWSVQRSMREAGQDRAEVVGLCEERVGKAGVIGRRLVGGDGLDFVEQLPRMRKEFVGLGIVVKEIGTNTALRWLSGAEALAQGGREAEAEGGMGSV